MRRLAEGVPPHRHALRETGRSFSWDVSACNDPAISQTTVFRQSLASRARHHREHSEQSSIRQVPVLDVNNRLKPEDVDPFGLTNHRRTSIVPFFYVLCKES